jgi:short-subunit dehydrogenase
LINVASVAGITPMPRFAVYGATKSYVIGFSQSLAEEVASFGMQVLALCPGPVPTEFQAVAGEREDAIRQALAIPADRVAGEALAALERGERLLVPGRLMWLTALPVRLLPARLLHFFGGRFT